MVRDDLFPLAKDSGLARADTLCAHVQSSHTAVTCLRYSAVTRISYTPPANATRWVTPVGRAYDLTDTRRARIKLQHDDAHPSVANSRRKPSRVQRLGPRANSRAKPPQHRRTRGPPAPRSNEPDNTRSRKEAPDENPYKVRWRYRPPWTFIGM